MRTVTATEAQNKFGKLIEDAQKEPVRISRNGRDQAVLLSVEEFERLKTAPSVRPEVKALHDRLMKKRHSVYEALAK